MVYQLALNRAMHIQSIPMCESICMSVGDTKSSDLGSPGTGSHDNYAYLVIDDKSESKDAVIIDPAHPEEYAFTTTIHYNMGRLAEISCRVVPVLKPQTNAKEINLTAIVNTHQ